MINMSMETDSHLLHLQGAYNVRDLGGYAARNGRHTCQNVFFRADNTAALTADDIRVLRDRGITLAIDLRSRLEAREQPSRLAGAEGVHYVQVEMLDEISSNGFRDFPPSLTVMYKDNLDKAQASFAQVFHLFAQNSGAALFHCTAGKDRTGMTAMLLLELAGVPDETIIADYAATEEYMQPVFSGIVKHMHTLGVEVPDYALRSEPDVMEQTLAYLRSRYGDARQYLLSGGVTAEELDVILSRFVA